MNIKNARLKIDNTDMDYITFGSGDRTMIMIPGLGDGMKTAKGMALPFALMYGKYTKGYKVYVFSRKNRLTHEDNVRTMAADLVRAMDMLGIEKADILGVSQGGMIAQYVVIDFPERVNRLVLAVTIAKQNPTIERLITSWLRMVANDDYMSVQIDMAEKMYTDQYLKKMRRLYPILGRVGKPKSFHRFVLMANACTGHDASAELHKIKSPTLVIGAALDKVVTGSASRELAALIPGSRLYMYRDYGHGVYVETPDFNRRVMDFFNE